MDYNRPSILTVTGVVVPTVLLLQSTTDKKRINAFYIGLKHSTQRKYSKKGKESYLNRR